MAAISVTAVLAGCATPSGEALEGHAQPLPQAPRRVPSAGPKAQVEMATVKPNEKGNGPAEAEQTREVSLAGVLRTARERAAQVLEAAARADVQAGRRLEAIGALAPRLEVGGRLHRLDGQEISNFGLVQDVSFTELESGGGLRWRLNPGAAAARIAATSNRLEAAEQRVDDSQRRAMLAAGVTYYELLLARAALDVAKRRQAAAESFRDIARARLETGAANEADVQRAKAELAVARRNAIDARQDWQQASIALATLLRWDPSTRLVPQEQEVHTRSLTESTAAEQLVDQATRSRADLLAAEARAEAASSQTEAAWWEMVGPEVNAGVRGRSTGTLASGQGSTFLGTLVIGWSIGFDQLGRIRAADNRARRQAIKVRFKERQVRGEVRAALNRVEQRAQSVEEARRGVKAARRNRAIQRERFKAGTGLGIEVIQAQKDLARARLRLAQAIVRYNSEQIRLLASVGRLAPQVAQVRQ